MVKNIYSYLAAILITLFPPFALGSESLPTDLKRRLDGIFEGAALDAHTPGLVYGVVVGEKLAHARALGVRSLRTKAPVTTETRFRIASMTKMMTALLVLDLQDQGRIFLDAPAETYVPHLKRWAYPTKDSRKVTVRDLLQHTSGFVTDDPWADRQMSRTPRQLDRFLAEAQPFTAAPGATWSYSNFGYAILGRLIETVTKQSFAQRLETRILRPLGMTASGLNDAALSKVNRAMAYNWVDGAWIAEPILKSGTFDPLGGVWTTAEDYARFVGWFLSAWPARDDPDEGPIPRRVVRAMVEHSALIGVRSVPGFDSRPGCARAVGYSMGIGVSRHCKLGRVLHHGGGFPGYGSYVLFMPDRNIAVFAFSNRTYAGMAVPAWDAAAVLADASVPMASNLSAADGLTAAYEAVKKTYRIRSIRGGGLKVADNFYLDRSSKRWNAQLEAIARFAGRCEGKESLDAHGRLSGSFLWRCQRGRVFGQIVMAPVDPSAVQRLTLRAVRRDGLGREMVINPDFH